MSTHVNWSYILLVTVKFGFKKNVIYKADNMSVYMHDRVCIIFVAISILSKEIVKQFRTCNPSYACLCAHTHLTHEVIYILDVYIKNSVLCRFHQVDGISCSYLLFLLNRERHLRRRAKQMWEMEHANGEIQSMKLQGLFRTQKPKNMMRSFTNLLSPWCSDSVLVFFCYDYIDES